MGGAEINVSMLSPVASNSTSGEIGYRNVTLFSWNSTSEKSDVNLEKVPRVPVPLIVVPCPLCPLRHIALSKRVGAFYVSVVQICVSLVSVATKIVQSHTRA